LSQIPPSANRRMLLVAFFVTLGLFATYNLNFRHGSGVDTIGSTLLPVSLLREGNLDLNEFRDLLDNESGTLRAGLAFGTLQERDGRLLNSYPPGAGILAAPVFAIALATGNLESWHDYRVTAKLAASLMVALSGGFLFLTLRSWLPQGPSLALTALYGLGTSAWPVASQELWQHPPGMLCLSIGIYCLIRMDQTPNLKYALITGFCFALAIIIRNLNLFPAVALSLYILIRQRRYLPYFLLPLISVGAVTAVYNLTTYGDLSGGYSAIYTSKWHGWRGLTPENSFSLPLLRGLANILLAPSKGALIYSPYMLFGIIAMFMFRTVVRHPLGPYLVLWVLLMLYVLSKNLLWWGGTAYGARYFSELAIALTLLIGVIWPTLAQHRWFVPILAVLGACSILIQAVGAFLYPCNWEETPRRVDIFTERYWDLSDMQITRCVREACDKGPPPLEILEYQPGDPDF